MNNWHRPSDRQYEYNGHHMFTATGVALSDSALEKICAGMKVQEEDMCLDFSLKILFKEKISRSF